MSIDVRVVEDAQALAVHAAQEVVDQLRAALEARGSATLCLSGGSTPRTTYERIAGHHRHALPWERVTFLFGDERCVPADDVASNARMAREAMLVTLGVPRAHVLRIEGEHGPALASELYEARLRETFPGVTLPRIDMLLLGIGNDGHTASLFPGDAALEERERWVCPARAPDEPHDRVTLTFPVLTAARRALVLVSGAGKTATVDACLRHLGERSGETSATVPPAARVTPTEGSLSWLIDEAAAG